MLFFRATTMVLFTALSVTSAEKEWPRSKSGRDLAAAPIQPKAPTLGDLYEPDGTLKQDFLQYRPSECDRRGLRTHSLITFCPTPELSDMWNWPCIRFQDLCNSIKNCPNGEDEDPSFCYYVKHQKERMELIRDKMDVMLHKSEQLVAGQFEERRRK